MPGLSRRTHNPYDRQYRKRRAAVLANAHTCVYCGKPISDQLPPGHPHKATADHAHAVANGGSGGVLVPACWTCNTRKRDKPVSTLTDDAKRGAGWF